MAIALDSTAVRAQPMPAAAELEKLAARDIAVLTGEVIELEVTDDQLVGVRLADGRQVPLRVLAVGPRFSARAEALAPLGLFPVDFMMGEQSVGNYLAADATGQTAVPGVWVAGNVTDPMAQLISAAGAGVLAAANINAELIATETAAAVARRRVTEPPTVTG